MNLYVQAFFENVMTDNILMLGVRIKFANMSLKLAFGSEAK